MTRRKKKTTAKKTGGIMDRYKGGNSKARSASVDKRANQRGGNYDSMFHEDVKVYKVRDGENHIRIMPVPEGMEAWALAIYVHYGVGPDEQSYLCLKNNKMAPGDGRDPVEEEILREKRAGANKDDLKRISAKQRALVWLIDRKEPEKGPQLWAMPWTLERDICKQSRDPKTGEYAFIDNLEEGYDVFFTREGKGKKTQYSGIMLDRRPSPLADDEDEIVEWLEIIDELPLEQTLQFYDFEHIQEVFGGMIPAADDDDDEEEEETRTRSSRRRTRSRRDEEEEEDDGSEDLDLGSDGSDEDDYQDDEDEQEEDEQEEEEKPRRRRRRTAAPPY